MMKKTPVDLFWSCSVMVITITQLHSTNPELWFCPGLHPTHGVLEIRYGEDF